MPLQMEFTIDPMGHWSVFVTYLTYDMLRRHRDSSQDVGAGGRDEEWCGLCYD
jgi:hypothetical protein